MTPSLFSHPPPGLMGGQPGLPLQQPDLPVFAPADVPGDEIARLQQELIAKKQAILRWEDGMKQAYSVSSVKLYINIINVWSQWFQPFVNLCNP